MNKEDKEFLDEIEDFLKKHVRDVDIRFQKIKEQNFDLQQKIILLQDYIYDLKEELKASRISIWRSIWKLFPEYFK